MVITRGECITSVNFRCSLGSINPLCPMFTKETPFFSEYSLFDHVYAVCGPMTGRHRLVMCGFAREDVGYVRGCVVRPARYSNWCVARARFSAFGSSASRSGRRVPTIAYRFGPCDKT